ncbi:MAG: chloride channel protein [Cytophagales bacterium]
MSKLNHWLVSIFSFFELWLSHRQFIVLCSIIIGLLAGIASTLLKLLVHYIRELVQLMYEIEWLGLMPAVMPIFGICLSVWYVIRFRNSKLGKGLGNVLYFMQTKKSRLPKDMTFSHIITSGLTVGFGGSAGLEAPIVVTGSALGSNLSQFTSQRYKDRSLMLACGASAGIAAAFNAPVAGMVFSVELLLNTISVSTFLPLIIASVSGAIFSQVLMEKEIIFSFDLKQPFDYHNVVFYILLGVCCGFIALFYTRMTLKVEKFFSGLGKKYSYKKALIGGTLLGVLIWLFPSFYGEGYETVKYLAMNEPEKVLENSIFSHFSTQSWWILLFIALIGSLKVFATSLTLSSGGNGGNFAPSLFVGSFVGFVFATTVNLIFGYHLPIENFVLVGMAGLMSGLFHAPLMAIFLIAELTGGYNLMIPLMIVSAISLLVKRHYMPLSLEKHKLASKNLVVKNE